MAQYRVIKKSYIHDKLYEPGEVVEWDGPQGTNLEPIGNEKRPPENSIFTGQPGPDPGAPPPQSAGKSEFDEGGPTRATALREYDEKRKADEEPDIPSTEPQVLARRAEADGKQAKDAEDPEVQARAAATAGVAPSELPRKPSKPRSEKPPEG
jgi:hypothetical protein